jgi:hypothetical protein
MHEKGSPEEKLFFEKSRNVLEDTPYAKDFKVFFEVSKKNDYDYGFSMTFDSEEAYDRYSFEYEPHREYVNEVWLKEVTDFFEIDLVEKTNN